MKQCICTHWYQAASKQKGMNKLYAKKNQQKKKCTSYMRPKTFTSCVLSEKSTKGMHKLRATLENSIAMHKLCAE